MSIVEEYAARIEETCGEERDFVVIFKYDKKDEAITKVLEKATIKKSISRIIFELTFRNISFRLYGSGKAIFRNFKDEGELRKVLTELLS